MPETLLELAAVSQVFKTRQGEVRAVDDVSLQLGPGQVVCLVGESGSGKTTTAKLAAGLRRPTSGVVRYVGQDIWRMEQREFSAYRRAVQYIHQDPYASLNPVHTVFDTLAAPLRHHRLVSSRSEAVRRTSELLTRVDLSPPESFLFKYPHQLSGGQRQRVSVARALTLEPRLIVADEATSMLDVSIRVSLLHLLSHLRENLGVAFLFITHDLAIAKYFAWQGHIAVMYLGRVVEFGPTPRIINAPQHPYTRALLAAIPEPDPDLTRHRERVPLRSPDAASLLRVPPGCSFHPRCPRFEAGLCDVRRPELDPIGAEHSVACHVVAREHAAGPLVAGAEVERRAVS
jgi:oligopeptide/dipeptide ABC transporter ATP-binding protein